MSKFAKFVAKKVEKIPFFPNLLQENVTSTNKVEAKVAMKIQNKPGIDK